MSAITDQIKQTMEAAAISVVKNAAMGLMTTAFTMLLGLLTKAQSKEYVEDFLDLIEIKVAKTESKIDDLLVSIVAGAARAALGIKDEDREVIIAEIGSDQVGK